MTQAAGPNAMTSSSPPLTLKRLADVERLLAGGTRNAFIILTDSQLREVLARVRRSLAEEVSCPNRPA